MYKPKVFLSHSKKDISFIEHIESILRKCQIDTWLDDIDIQHGSNWLDSIFEDGIAKCDLVLVYITENSITSPMVAKEIDAALIAQLKSNSIKLLLYVENKELRNRLRLDLQTLQIPVLNNDNFSMIFPVIVSNIWNYYFNHIVGKIEKEKNLEIENLRLTMELERSNKIGFVEYDKEFDFILENLNRETGVNIKHNETDDVLKQETVNLLFVVLRLYQIQGEINGSKIHSIVSDYIRKKLKSLSIEINNGKIEIGERIFTPLLTFGFLKRNFNPMQPKTNDNQKPFTSYFHPHKYEIYTLSKKMDTFIMWLQYNRKIPKGLEEILNA